MAGRIKILPPKKPKQGSMNYEKLFVYCIGAIIVAGFVIALLLKNEMAASVLERAFWVVVGVVFGVEHLFGKTGKVLGRRK